MIATVCFRQLLRASVEPLYELALTNEADEFWETLTPEQRHWLPEAYAVCERITRRHSATFHLAAGLLPTAKRRAVHALYAFCRCTDDIVDRLGAQAAEVLPLWQDAVLTSGEDARSLVALAWRDAANRHRVPRRYAQQLMAGVARDLECHRYATFAELATYCYAVASTVGLMAMHIIGFSGAEAVPRAIDLGVALQLTNILRDVGEDWKVGRLYLPQEELAAFDIDERAIAEGLTDSRWRAFMQFQIERARLLYAQSLPGIAHLDRTGRFAIAVAAELYRAILSDIERNGYDVFQRRAHVGTWGKLLRLPPIWLRTITLAY